MLLIFDLDGTVLDTYQLIRASFIHTFEKHLPNYQYTEEKLDSYFGPVLDDSFGSLTDDHHLVQEMIKTYREFNLSSHDKYVSAFPNGPEIIEKLYYDNFQLAVFSNKRRDAVMLGLNIIGLTKYFEVILGSDDVENVKPHPEGVLRILDHFKTKNAIMIGDTAYDMQAAKNSGIISIGVAWSNTSVEELKKYGADYIAYDYLELYEIIKGVNNNV